MPNINTLFDEDKDREVLEAFQHQEPDYYLRSKRIMDKLNEVYRILNLLAESAGI